ncbi:MAG TPA: hypothetical protein VG755_03130 [Nannocystaceae bacterium]|nr:hypothetical protein [Nannocystaceae bacterium]
MRLERHGLAALVLGLAGIGCGLRSDPLFEGELLEAGNMDAEEGESGPSTGPSECDEPAVMPFENVTVRGHLDGGRGGEQGWCGQDGGPEKVYSLTPAFSTDVIFAVTEADTPLTLRVIEDGCSDGEGITRICANDFVEQPRHFFAQAGHTYSVIVDSDVGAEGDFAFSVTYGWPSLTDCPIHDEVILQQPGGSFQWYNDFGRGQGMVDGACGGAGRENMFKIQVDYTGGMYAEVTSSDGFEPVISLRTSCAAISELKCSSAAANGYATLDWYLDAPGGEYYLVVDQVGYAGGSYGLNVYFD